MKIRDMTNAETKAHLLEWCDKPDMRPFAWPTDACGYDQHIKFVHHRNDNWKGGGFDDFVTFVKAYANTLETSKV